MGIVSRLARQAREGGEKGRGRLWRQALERAEKAQEKLNVFITLAKLPHLPEGTGLSGALAGVPYAAKDNICTAGLRTTAGSRMLEHFVPPYNATVIERLRAAGAVLIGKTNLDEFAMGSSTEFSLAGPAHNPWDLSRVAGGSSGGSAAAVAAGIVPFALGSDTGGSIRQPASFCGVAGFKPSYGRVSRWGLIAYASSFDQIGVFARHVEDIALVYEIMAGEDKCDATTSARKCGKVTAALGGDVRGLRIGLPREYFGEGVEEGVRECVWRAKEVFLDAGARIIPLSLPLTDVALAAYLILTRAEASANLARYDGLRFGGVQVEGGSAGRKYAEIVEETRSKLFGVEVQRRILLGTFVLSAGYKDRYYLQAARVREKIRAEFKRAWREVDLILSPTTPEVAFPLGAKRENPLRMYLSDVLNVAAPLAGLPAISVPCGFVEEKKADTVVRLPVGLQLMGPQFEDTLVLRAAYQYQRRTGWHQEKPPHWFGEE
jgi:aspartyl-tRNA(Asn)/glutamyl-tRNA(Gln) amidotransferase subunit A